MQANKGGRRRFWLLLAGVLCVLLISIVWELRLPRVLLAIAAGGALAVGIFTAFCGGPFFVWLLYRKNKYGRM